MNHRGTREFDSWIANTWPSSCHSTMPQLMSPVAGDIAVITWPKHTPSARDVGQPDGADA